MPAGWESLFGEVEVLSDQEAELDKTRAEESYHAGAEHVKRCLRDPRLKPWWDRFRELSHGGAPPSFFQFFNETEKSVRKMLRSSGYEHAYIGYSEWSSLVHGSTLENSVAGYAGFFAPLFGDVTEELGWAREQFVNSARFLWLLLASMQPALPLKTTPET